MRHSFRFSGTGGQGLITAGIILAEAALLDDKLAVQSQSYGPEARGGSSKAEAIISDEPIYFSRVICPDTLLVMSQEAANKFIADCDEHTTVITDTLFVNEVPGKYGKRVDLPITHTANTVCGKTLFAARHCLRQDTVCEYRCSGRSSCPDKMRFQRSNSQSCTEPRSERNRRS